LNLITRVGLLDCPFSGGFVVVVALLPGVSWQ
jgi:hypothetical protein